MLVWELTRKDRFSATLSAEPCVRTSGLQTVGSKG
jgi:hypothetical protein